MMFGKGKAVKSAAVVSLLLAGTGPVTGLFMVPVFAEESEVELVSDTLKWKLADFEEETLTDGYEIILPLTEYLITLTETVQVSDEQAEAAAEMIDAKFDGMLETGIIEATEDLNDSSSEGGITTLTRTITAYPRKAETLEFVSADETIHAYFTISLDAYTNTFDNWLMYQVYPGDVMFAEDGDTITVEVGDSVTLYENIEISSAYPGDKEAELTANINDNMLGSGLFVMKQQMTGMVDEEVNSIVTEGAVFEAVEEGSFVYVGFAGCSSFTIEVVDPIADFVRRLYGVCLGREADPSGLEHWTTVLESGQRTGIEVAKGFIFSTEFKNKNYCNEHYTEHLYAALMGREPDEGGMAHWLEVLTKGITREEVFNRFANSAEFRVICSDYGITVGSAIPIPTYGTVAHGSCSICGEEAGVTQFVKRLYRVCLNREADSSGQAHWETTLWEHVNTGTKVAYGFVFSDEFQGKAYSNADYVEHLYEALMGRSSDAAGKAHWINKLNNGYTRLEIFNSFAGSTEFSQICARYGIERGSGIPVPPKVTPAQESGSSSSSSGSASYTYVANKNSGIFHRSTCPTVKRMSEKNKLTGYSREQLIAWGYDPCNVCNP